MELMEKFGKAHSDTIKVRWELNNAFEIFCDSPSAANCRKLDDAKVRFQSAKQAERDLDAELYAELAACPKCILIEGCHVSGCPNDTEAA